MSQLVGILEVVEEPAMLGDKPSVEVEENRAEQLVGVLRDLDIQIHTEVSVQECKEVFLESERRRLIGGWYNHPRLRKVLKWLSLMVSLVSICLCLAFLFGTAVSGFLSWTNFIGASVTLVLGAVGVLVWLKMSWMGLLTSGLRWETLEWEPLRHGSKIVYDPCIDDDLTGSLALLEVPSDILQKATEVQRRLPNARFRVEYLNADPFLIVEHGARFYIGVWSEANCPVVSN